MTQAVRTSLVVAVLASGAALTVLGCSSNEPAGTSPEPMGGAMESGKMQGGAMAPAPR